MAGGIQVQGLSVTLAQLRAVAEAAAEGAATGLDAVAERVIARAQELCPVESGTLKRSIGRIRGKRTRDAVELTIGVRPRYARNFRGRLRDPEVYGAFVEYGTRLAQAQPFLRPAVDQEAPGMVGTVGSAVQAAISSVVRP